MPALEDQSSDLELALASADAATGEFVRSLAEDGSYVTPRVVTHVRN